jgi:transforming growth factor-beta-induced protein
LVPADRPAGFLSVAVVNRIRLVRALSPFVALVPLVGLTACSEDESNSLPPATEAPAGAGGATETTVGATTTLPPYVSPLGDIVGEALTKNAQFTSLAAMVVEAGLVEALRGDGPFTVFAPTNDAIAAVPAETLDAIWADPDLLTDVLTYHVVAGESLTAADLTDGQVLTTLQGQTLTIGKSGDNITVNGIEVLIPDVPATNGTIHAIGGVLVPEG